MSVIPMPMAERKTEKSSHNGIISWITSAFRSTFRPAGSPRQPLHAFAHILENISEPDEVQVAFLERAYKLSRAVRVELWSETEGRSRLRACWPDSPADDARPGKDADTADWLRLPIRAAGKTQGYLRLKAVPSQVWSPRLLNDLTTMALMATSAERALRNDCLADIEALYDIVSGLHNSTFLQAILNYIVHQAQRRHESVSLIYIGIDRLGAIEKLHGPDVTIQVLRRVSATILKTLRSSDVIGRLEDGRLVAVLPNVNAVDSRDVAEALCRAISEAGKPTSDMPILTASLGVATYPEHAHDAPSLRAAAAGALMKAQAMGRSQVAESSLVNPVSPIALATVAG